MEVSEALDATVKNDIYNRRLVPEPQELNSKKLHGKFWDIVLSRMSFLGGFGSSRCHGSNRKNEIYNPGMVPELPELKKILKKSEILLGTFWDIVFTPF